MTFPILCGHKLNKIFFKLKERNIVRFQHAHVQEANNAQFKNVNDLQMNSNELKRNRFSSNQRMRFYYIHISLHYDFFTFSCTFLEWQQDLVVISK